MLWSSTGWRSSAVLRDWVGLAVVGALSVGGACSVSCAAVGDTECLNKNKVNA